MTLTLSNFLFLILASVVEFEPSKRNGQKLLVLDGVRYFRNRQRNDKQYWKCSYYYKNKCPAIVIIETNTSKVFTNHTHTHPTPSEPNPPVVHDNIKSKKAKNSVT